MDKKEIQGEGEGKGGERRRRMFPLQAPLLTSYRPRRGAEKEEEPHRHSSSNVDYEDDVPNHKAILPL